MNAYTVIQNYEFHSDIAVRKQDIFEVYMVCRSLKDTSNMQNSSSDFRSLDGQICH